MSVKPIREFDAKRMMHAHFSGDQVSAITGIKRLKPLKLTAIDLW